METIIVTVTNARNSFSVDLEVPTNLAWSKLAEDVVDTLNGGMPELNLTVYGHSFFCQRLRKPLEEKQTLREAGVWNGDYLVVMQK